MALLVAASSLCCTETSQGEQGGDGGEGGATAPPLVIDCPEPERDAGEICLGRVVGIVEDAEGVKMSHLPVTVCGPVCFRGVTDEHGRFEIEVGRFVSVSEYSIQPHGTPTHSTYYYQFPEDLSDGDHRVGVLRVIELSDDGDRFVTKLDLEDEPPPEQYLSSTGIRLKVGEGTVVRLAVQDALAGHEGRRFRVKELNEAQAEDFGFELKEGMLFALGPFETEFLVLEGRSVEVSLEVDNTKGWTAGSEVEVMALGTYLDPTWLTPSSFEPIGIGHVSEDGERIVLSAEEEGPGLRYLTWLSLSIL